MGVFFRTGEHTAAGISWPTYLLLVAPVQLLYGFLKLIILGFKWLAIGIAAVAAFTVRTVRGHRENRPPAA